MCRSLIALANYWQKFVRSSLKLKPAVCPLLAGIAAVHGSPIATDRILVADLRFRGITDMAGAAAGWTRSRMTHSGHERLRNAAVQSGPRTPFRRSLNLAVIRFDNRRGLGLGNATALQRGQTAGAVEVREAYSALDA
jgi:hypothetical protein